MEVIIPFFIIHWYTSLFFQTFFLHRYASHQAFTMSKFWERVFYVLTWVFQGSNYLSAYGYGVMHRLHHAFADTEKDPHSPKYDESLFKMMWKTKTIYSAISDGKMEVDTRFTNGTPQWKRFDSFARSWVSRLFWGTAYFAVYYFYADVWWLWLFLPLQFILSPIHGAIINWFAHKYGYRNFEVKDTSRNFLPVDFLMMGESYHNNHHKHGNRANFGGFRWHEIDPTYLIIRILNGLRIIRLNDEKGQMKKSGEPFKKAA
ncbi:MAG: acyl-CoA desaturase [Bacteroidota bacterium]